MGRPAPDRPLGLLGWRRAVAALYADVRATTDRDGPAAAHAVWQAGRTALLATSAESPVAPAERPRLVERGGLDVAAYDPAMRFVAEVEPADEQRLEVLTATDGVVPFERVGQVRVGDLGTLDVWWLASYGGGLFVPLKDRSAGRTTYGGGRYLLDTVKGADLGGDGERRLVLDLNFAYNPSCAYDPAWMCPLAQPGNTLDVELDVGERVYRAG